MDTSERSICEAILSRVAEREGVDELDLDPPLFDVIDPDALESLFRGTRGMVRFEYHGYDVTVDHQGRVDVAPLTDD